MDFIIRHSSPTPLFYSIGSNVLFLRSKVLAMDPKLFLRIKCYYSESKVITPDSRFYFRCIDPIQFKISILEFEDVISSSPFSMAGAQGERQKRYLFLPFRPLTSSTGAGCPVPIFFYFLSLFLFCPIFKLKPPIFPIFLAGEAKICNKIETRIFRCMCLQSEIYHKDGSMMTLMF